MLRKSKGNQRLAQETETIAEIGRIISSTLNIDEIYERFAQEVKKLIEFDRISIININQKENTATIAYTWGIFVSGRQNESAFSLNGSVAGKIVEARSSLLFQGEDEKEIAYLL